MKSVELKEYNRNVGYKLKIKGDIFLIVAEEVKNGLTKIIVTNLTKGRFDAGSFDLGQKLRNKAVGEDSEMTRLVNQLEETYNKEERTFNETELKLEFAQIINS